MRPGRNAEPESRIRRRVPRLGCWNGPQQDSRGSLAQNATRLLRTFAANPVAVSRSLPSEVLQKHGSIKYSATEVDENWYEHLHGLLGAPWPCAETERLDALMTDIGSRLVASGLATGRYTYGWYSDADITLARAVWCTARHVRPDVVIETGVAHGVTSRIILEAMNQNDLAGTVEHRPAASAGPPAARRDRGRRDRRLPAALDVPRGREQAAAPAARV